MAETTELISIMQEQLKLQRQLLEEQRRQAKERLDQAKAEAKKAEARANEIRRQAEARVEKLTNLLEEQRWQAEAREDKLIKALTKGAASTSAPLPVASGGIPKFTPFDASVELWKDYLARFVTFVGANSIPAGKAAQVFLTSQSTTYTT